MNDEHELRPLDHLDREEKAPLLKAGSSNDAETVKRWKSAASDNSRIPQSLAQAYSNNNDEPVATPPRGRMVSESFKTRTNQSSQQGSYLLVIVVFLLVAGVALCKYVFKVF